MGNNLGLGASHETFRGPWDLKAGNSACLKRTKSLNQDFNPTCLQQWSADLSN